MSTAPAFRRRGRTVAAAAACVMLIGPTPAHAEDDDGPEVDEDGCVLGIAEDDFPVGGNDPDERRVVAWPQSDLKPDRAWSTTTGDGVTVAVLDSGVADDHPLLEGKVLDGNAYVDQNSATDEDDRDLGDGGRRDCVGHGTAVAGIIAGDPSEGHSGFYGLAPDSEILPVRVANEDPSQGAETSEDADDDSDYEPEIDESDFAAAIDWAVANEADVINLSLKYDNHFTVIEEAVNNALAEGVVLVAAGGNDGADSSLAQEPAYPAAYDGVIGVGAVNQQIVKTETSQWGEWIDVVAPGEELVTLERDGQFNVAFGGTSGATAYVSATAALLKERYPDWTVEQIAAQITATAGPTPAGNGHTDMYGHGMIDPYRAVSETVRADAEPAELPHLQDPDVGPDYAQAVSDAASAKTWSLWFGLAAVTVFFGALFGVAALRRARLKGWHVKKVDKDDQIETLDDGEPIPIYQGIKGLKH